MLHIKTWCWYTSPNDFLSICMPHEINCRPSTTSPNESLSTCLTKWWFCCLFASLNDDYTIGLLHILKLGVGIPHTSPNAILNWFTSPNTIGLVYLTKYNDFVRCTNWWKIVWWGGRIVYSWFREVYELMKSRLVRLLNSNSERREMWQENDKMSRNGLLVKRSTARYISWGKVTVNFNWWDKRKHR